MPRSLPPSIYLSWSRTPVLFVGSATLAHKISGFFFFGEGTFPASALQTSFLRGSRTRAKKLAAHRRGRRIRTCSQKKRKALFSLSVFFPLILLLRLPDLVACEAVLVGNPTVPFCAPLYVLDVAMPHSVDDADAFFPELMDSAPSRPVTPTPPARPPSPVPALSAQEQSLQTSIDRLQSTDSAKALPATGGDLRKKSWSVASSRPPSAVGAPVEPGVALRPFLTGCAAFGLAVFLAVLLALHLLRPRFVYTQPAPFEPPSLSSWRFLAVSLAVASVSALGYAVLRLVFPHASWYSVVASPS